MAEEALNLSLKLKVSIDRLIHGSKQRSKLENLDNRNCRINLHIRRIAETEGAETWGQEKERKAARQGAHFKISSLDPLQSWYTSDHNSSQKGLLEIKAVKSGIVRIQAKKTSQFLCMKPNGQLYGSLVYLGEACNFRETVLQDGYNLYYSELHNLPLSLSSTGTLSRSRQLPPFSQFLPIRNRIPVEPAFVDYNFYEQELDVESADPLGMMDQNRGFISPSYVF
ncbi:fibroblast growth factor 21 isoform X1 [Hemicordylus capensis]|uniref:fibroblast growth factor 21 isoform X1 n=1 Tax=Hemicordylus capensis TaxID=884348 RepID=UPI00230225DB|nr:fibroblast growth factor 21 isoform X1 [Hemicordylus capensis]